MNIYTHNYNLKPVLFIFNIYTHNLFINILQRSVKKNQIKIFILIDRYHVVVVPTYHIPTPIVKWNKIRLKINIVPLVGRYLTWQQLRNLLNNHNTSPLFDNNNFKFNTTALCIEKSWLFSRYAISAVAGKTFRACFDKTNCQPCSVAIGEQRQFDCECLRKRVILSNVWINVKLQQ